MCASGDGMVVELRAHLGGYASAVLPRVMMELVPGLYKLDVSQQRIGMSDDAVIRAKVRQDAPGAWFLRTVPHK